jgi:hypothetical protein
MSRYTHFTKLKHLIFPNGGSTYADTITYMGEWIPRCQRVFSRPTATGEVAPALGYQLRVHDNSMRAEDEMRMEGENEVDEGEIESTRSVMTREWHW